MEEIESVGVTDAVVDEMIEAEIEEEIGNANCFDCKTAKMQMRNYISFDSIIHILKYLFLIFSGMAVDVQYGLTNTGLQHELTIELQ